MGIQYSFEEEVFGPLKLVKSFVKKVEQDYYVRVFNPLGSIESFVSFGLLGPVKSFAFWFISGLFGFVGILVVRWDLLEFL